MVSCSDIVYCLSLLTCIMLGGSYRNLNDPATKRTYGTGLGILITCMICGSAVLHSALMVWGNIVIIKCCNKLYMHQLSLAYTWLYLIYMNYNMDLTSNYVLWIHQVIALRLVGLACELTLAEKCKRQTVKTLADSILAIASDQQMLSRISNIKLPTSHELGSKHSTSRFNNGDLTTEPTEPSATDIISYAYYFIGLHKGNTTTPQCLKSRLYNQYILPTMTYGAETWKLTQEAVNRVRVALRAMEYSIRGVKLRWKSFNDHFKTPFGMLGSCRIITEQKLKKAFIFSIFYVVLRLKFPVQVYYENEFYHSHGTDFRYLYNIPQMVTYVLQYQVVMMLCTSVCTEAGFGIYPSKTQPLPGHGPSTKLSLLDLLTATKEVALEQEYNFAMLRSFENEKLLKGPRMRDTLRGWDMSTRYWFWSHMQKELFNSNKEVRSVFAKRALSFLAWSLWCGPTLQQLVISSTMWVHLQLEREYTEFYGTHTSLKVPWDIGFSIMRLFCLIYLTPCLILKEKAVVLRYYNSIYWVYHMVLIILILGAVGVQKQRIMSRRAADEEL